MNKVFNRHVLDIDAADEIRRIVQMLRQTTGRIMHRRGGVVGISGGIDSSVVLALCVRAFGAAQVTALLLPDRDSDSESEPFARRVAEQLGVEPILENITPALEGLGCYARRDAAIRRVFPEYDAAAGYKAKIVLPKNLLDDGTLNVFSLTIITPAGMEKTQRLPSGELAQIVAASNLKQRTRMVVLYYHAEQRNYAVIGTANKDEHLQGFFVKYGDGGVDIRPIVHLYKTQVYQLAGYLGIPEDVRQRTPTTDTYSTHQTQEEFFFRLPFNTLDLLWYAQEHAVPVSDVSAVLDLSEEQIQHGYADLNSKQRATHYLRMAPVDLFDQAENPGQP
jgi:NAD+ synthase